MSAGSGSRSLAPAGRFRRRWLPFWLLQIAELTVALAFVDSSVRVDRGGLLVGTAICLFALALTARGPLGLFRICDQPLHLVTVMVAGVLVAGAPVIPALRPDLQGIIVVEFGAIGLIRLATFTATAPAVPGSRIGRTGRGGRPGPPVIEATATVAGPARRTPSAGAPGPEAPSPARWAGWATASAAATGRRAAARFLPVAEARVRRTLRSAGRAAGKARSAKPDGTKSG